jgi:hypothetical protein
MIRRVFEDDETQRMVEAAFEYHGLLKDTLNKMSGRKGYTRCKEQFTATSTSYIPELDLDIDSLKERFVKLYDNWKANRDPEMPGIKLKNIPLLSPAELKTVTNAKIFTVEQLAEVGETGLGALGMGARELQKKAKNYLLAMNDQGKLVQENTRVSEENAALKIELKELQEIVALMKAEQRVTKNNKSNKEAA